MGPGKRYYYTIRRDGKRMVYQYWGASEAAGLIAQLEAIDVEKRQLDRFDRQQARIELAELASTPPELLELLAEARRATAEALQAAGYHQHKRGEWRKRRAGKDKDEESPAP